jgi:hypothetical protein
MGASMKIISLSAVGLTLLLGLSACGSNEVVLRDDLRTDAQRAQACVARYDPQGKASQIMTYDSKTKTEVHLNTDGKDIRVTGQNSTDNTSVGMGAEVGGYDLPTYCTDQTVKPSSGKSSKRSSFRMPWM